MRISVLCDSPRHPVIAVLKSWIEEQSSKGHAVELVEDNADLSGGDILFLVSYNRILHESDRSRYRATLVLHASDLPEGRGWSPHIWSILDGADRITVCLLEAREPVDSGAIWLKTQFSLEGHELLPEIHAKLFASELELMSEAIEGFETIEPVEQTGDPGDYLPLRTPADSELDPERTIAEQFDLLRVADHERYPAFIRFRGKKYLINIEKSENDE